MDGEAPPRQAGLHPAPGLSRGLSVSLGQYSDRGRKDTNQDFHGAMVPEGSVLALKGAAFAIADGISTSPVGHLAAQISVNSFLTDYYGTSDTWTVERAAHRVISATNAWLHAESRRGLDSDDPDRGYVCTFDAVVLKARTAHLFHVGDSRIYRVAGDSLEPLTEDHRVVLSGRSYLGRAMGMAPDVALDYRPVSLAEGDVLVLSTDGVHEHLSPRAIAGCIAADSDDLDQAARRIVEAAIGQGSQDNLTVQIVRIDRLPDAGAADFVDQAHELPLPPLPDPPATFDGYRLLRRIHANDRSHIYLARDAGTGAAVALKMPAMDLRADPTLLRQFVMEEWIAARVASPHLLKAAPPARPRNFLYVVTEHIEGVSLRQWMFDNPRPDLEAVRRIVEQLVKGARALHRNEIVHADLRPENVMIDAEGVVKIIDFGSARVEGLVQASPNLDGGLLGTLQYTAPECLAGEQATWRSDLFSIGVIAYEMLTGHLPYGAVAGRVRTPRDADRLRYTPAATRPEWIDGALRTATHPNPLRRYEALSKFVADLRTPSPRFTRTGAVPMAERDPVRFWQGVSVVLLAVVLGLLMKLSA
jgi:serine/threonine protein phosphatase PrpC